MLSTACFSLSVSDASKLKVRVCGINCTLGEDPEIDGDLDVDGDEYDVIEDVDIREGCLLDKGGLACGVHCPSREVMLGNIIER